MTSAIVEQGREWFHRRIEKLQQEVAALETQLAELERKKARSPALLQRLGQYLGFGAARKLGRARCKLKLKREELDRFETQYGVIGHAR